MAPRSTRTTKIGELLRATRAALSLDQAGLAQRVYVSSRQVSRWENGVRPPPSQAKSLVIALGGAPRELVRSLAEALDIEIVDYDPPAALPAPAVASPRSPDAALRASLDAVVYGASEQRDILPRHLRAFGVELLQAVDRLGLSAKDAASLVAVPDKTGAPAERATS